MNQEQNKIALYKHQAGKYKKQVDEQEERFADAYGQLKQELQAEREQKAESIHAQQDLDQEVALLKSKFQEESRKVARSPRSHGPRRIYSARLPATNERFTRCKKRSSR